MVSASQTKKWGEGRRSYIGKVCWEESCSKIWMANRVGLLTLKKLACSRQAELSAAVDFSLTELSIDRRINSFCLKIAVGVTEFLSIVLGDW